MLPFLEVGFSRSGEFSLRTLDLLRLINLVATSQASRTARIPAYKKCRVFVAINVVNPSASRSAVRRRKSDAIAAQDLHGMVMIVLQGAVFISKGISQISNSVKQNGGNHFNTERLVSNDLLNVG